MPGLVTKNALGGSGRQGDLPKGSRAELASPCLGKTRWDVVFSCDFLRSEEQAVGGFVGLVVHAMGMANASHPSEAIEEGHGEAPVYVAIVDHHVGQPKRGHPEADPEHHLSEGARSQSAPDDHRGCGDCVKNPEDIVGLESRLQAVMTAVNGPQLAVPCVVVHDARPRLHGHGDNDRSGDPDPGI